MNFLKRTWAEINLDALTHNINEIKSKIPKNQKIMGILKSDAYGHGDGFIGRKLQDLGFDSFGVSNINEAISLRNEKITKPILILGYSPIDSVSYINKYDLTQCVMGIDYAKMLQSKGEILNCTFNIHIKIDTGMNRLGFQCTKDLLSQSLKEIIEISNMKNLKITGIFTHYAVSDSFDTKDIEFTNLQYKSFMGMVSKLNENNVDIGVTHASNSAFAISNKNYEKNIDMCRLGIILYGILPSKEFKSILDLKPIMTLKTSIGFIKKVEANSAISYGLTHTLDKESIIATVPIGYADGYSRQLSNRGHMLINGKLAPVVGRVCMDQIMIDITNIDNVNIGDEVIVFGDNQLSVDDIAKSLNTISYEIICGITRRVPRVYYENEKIVGIVDYLIGN